jgi:xanthine dehydrogenase accessory factor
MQWYDSRPEFARPGVHIADEDGLIAAIEAAPPHAAVLIMTHDHGLDYRLTRAALGCDLALVGVIGSATKRARFLSGWRAMAWAIWPRGWCALSVSRGSRARRPR